MKKDLLVTLADENYVEQAKQLFSSVYWNAGWKGDYMLLAHEVPEKKLKWFKKKGILIRKCKPLHNKPVGVLKHPPIVLSKFYLFKPEFKKWKSIIFLDADIIVRAPLGQLTKVGRFEATHFPRRNLSEHFSNYNRINEKKFDKFMNDLKKDYDFEKTTFNSGVIAFNTEMIKEDTFSKLIRLFKLYKDIAISSDETMLNLLFYNKWQNLPIVYHIFPSIMTSNLLIRPKKIKGAILHFMMNQPWKSNSYFFDEWMNNLKKAELINLKKIPTPKKVWTKQEIKRYDFYIKKRHFWFKFIPQKTLSFIDTTLISIDKKIGLVGILLKELSPKIYFKLKKLKIKNNGIMEHPFVSIIICTQNRARALKKYALNSILRLNYLNYEVVVVDDASKDKTQEVLNEFRDKLRNLKIIKNKKSRGLGHVRNLGIRHAKGDIIAFMDDDCGVDKNWLNELIRPYLRDKKAMVVGGETYIHNSKKIFNPGKRIFGCNVSFRRKVFDRFSFDTNIYFNKSSFHDEKELICRIKNKGIKVVYADKAIVRHFPQPAEYRKNSRIGGPLNLIYMHTKKILLKEYYLLLFSVLLFKNQKKIKPSINEEEFIKRFDFVRKEVSSKHKTSYKLFWLYYVLLFKIPIKAKIKNWLEERKIEKIEKLLKG